MMSSVRKQTTETGLAINARIGRNVPLMVFSFAANYAASFATFPYLTRVLGSSHFGLLAYAMAVAAYGTLFTEWGMSLAGPRAVLKCRNDPLQLNTLIWSVLGAKALLCAVATLVLLVLLAYDVGGATARPVVWISWLGVVANVCTMYWLFQGLERFKLISTMILVNRAVTLPLTFWLVRTPQDIVIAAGIQSSGPVIAAFFSVLIASNEGWLRFPSLSWRAVSARITESADMFVATASVTLFGAANAIILTSVTGSYAAGIYAGADKIRTVCALVPTQLSAVLYPRIEALFRANKRESARLTVIGAILTLLVSLIGATASIAFAESITSIILGKQFSGAAELLRVLAASTVFGNLAYFLGLQILVPSGASKFRSLTIFIAGCLNVVIALLSVRKYAAMGAATSFFICEALILITYGALILKNRRLRRYLSLGMRSIGVLARKRNGVAICDGKRLRRTNVLHVGPGCGQRGGITSVLDELRSFSGVFGAHNVQLRFCETHGFKGRLGLLPFFLKDLPGYLKSLISGVDIVHLHVSVKGSFYRKLVLFSIARAMRKRVVFHLHAGNFSAFVCHSSSVIKFLARWFVCKSDSLIGVSRTIAKELVDLGGIDARPFVIGNSASAAERAFAETNAQPRKPGFVLFAGRLAEAKGIYELFQAIALLAQDGMRVDVVLAGSGDVDRWQKEAERLGIREQVRFPGWLEGEEKIACFRAASIFCMPSHHEAFGIATLEAMFAGLPIVGTKVGGFFDLVKSGRNGILVEPSNPQEVVGALRTLFDDPELAREMGQRGYERAYEQFSSDAIVSKYVDMYRETMER
jgi:glycosyltransferase involved in cell wall biosynthesis/O-antigen/teichoic acid export membrane protein